MRALAEADICRFLFFRPLAESAARELPKAFTAALIAFNCRSRLSFAFVSFCASFCNRSEEHTSELQSQSNLVCRLLLEKKKKISYSTHVQLYFDNKYVNCPMS